MRRSTTQLVVCFVLLGILAACGGGNVGQDPNEPALAVDTGSTSIQPAQSQPTTGPVLFITPRPVRAEEPLTGGSLNIPAVFEGITEYHAVQAALQAEELLPPPATTLAEAARAVVKIYRCDDFGCDSPVSSGVIIHASGLILTAYHVLLRDPDDPTSPRYEEFVIAPTTDIRAAPQPAYRARMVANKPDQDLALLQIDHRVDGETLAQSDLTLPTVPLANLSDLFGATLQVLGYPVNGGQAISIDRTDFRSFDDDGRLIVVDQPLNPGNSGGPALLEQNGHFAVAGIVIRRRSTQGQLSSEGLVRTIDQLRSLTWTPRVARATGEKVAAGVDVIDGEIHLQLGLSIDALDLVDRRLRLLFYATDAETKQPWQLANSEGPLVLWADVVPQQMLMRQAVVLSMPIAELGTEPERLRFHALLWDWDEQAPLWTDAVGVQLPAQAVALADTVTPTSTPLPPTNMGTIAPTAIETTTLQPTATSTPIPTAIATATPTVNKLQRMS